MKKFWNFIKELALCVTVQALMAILFVRGIFNKEQRRLFLGKTNR